LTRIAYAHDGANEYDSFFLDFLARNNVVFFLTFYPSPHFVSQKSILVKMPRILSAPTDKAEGLYMYSLFPLRAFLLKLYFRVLKPDVALGCLATKYGFYTALTGFKPFILIIWGSDILIAPRRFFLFRLMAQYALKKADVVIVDSQVQENAVLQLGCKKERIFKFPWFDLDDVRPTHSRAEIRNQLGWQDNLIVISLRRHEPIYGIEYLIEAMPHIVREVPDVRFLILSKGQLTEKFKLRVSELRMDNHVKFVGHVPRWEVATYLNAADIYVSTSLSDGTSAGLLEAMALKVPGVVTDISGNREWIKDRQNGFLAPTRNPQELCKSIVLLAKSNHLRREIGEKAFATVTSKVDWTKNSENLNNLILRLVSENQIRSPKDRNIS